MNMAANVRVKLDDDKRGGLPSWTYTHPEFLEIEKDELFRPLPHRSALDRLLGSLKDQAAKPMLVVVDPMGEVIAKTEKPLDALALQAFMKKALNESNQHVAAAKDA